MKNMMRISYTFILLAVGIVSTILSNPVLAQTEGNSQKETGQTSGGQQQGGQQQGGGEGADSGGQVKTGDDIGSIEELQSLTREGPPTSTKNDTTGLFQDLGEETSTDKGFAGDNRWTTTRPNRGLLVDNNNKVTKQLGLLVDNNNKGTKQLGLLVDNNNKGTKQLGLLVDNNNKVTKQLGLLVDNNNKGTKQLGLLVDQKGTKQEIL